MNKDLSCLRDPDTGASLQLLESGSLIGVNGAQHPIVKGIPRFVSTENYAKVFGTQWNRFPKTQLDSFTGIDISESRLQRCTRMNLSDLNEKVVLEAGSGAGRFTEVLLKYGAIVHAFDYSSAVDANAINNGFSDHLTLVQADLRRIPFLKGNYDFVVCLGVLQHTPNPEESISCLWEMLKPGGRLVIDHYRWNWGLVVPPPLGGAESLYRWLILKLPLEYRFRAVKAITDFWFPVHWFFREYPIVQRVLVRLSPVRFYYSNYKLRNRQMYYDWSLLDTHDGTTDIHKHYRTVKQIVGYLETIGAEGIEAHIGGNGVEASCRKPITGTIATI